MPIYDVVCHDCGHAGEILVLRPQETMTCPECHGTNLQRIMSPTSDLTGKSGQKLPGTHDTGCCGAAPGHAGCAGPGSCCGKSGA